MKNIYFSLSNIYYYSTIIVFSIFTTFSTVFFHKYIFVNINILIFLVFLYFNILVLILFCLRKKNYSVINFIAFFFIFLFIFEIYLYNKNYESQSISKLKNYQMNDKIENYLKIVYPRYILEMQSNYNIDNSDYFYLSGISNQKTALCNEDNFWSTYKSDRHGFNNKNELWDKKIEVAVFGDSFSHGNCVLEIDQWVNKLKKNIPNVLNLSMGGNGPLTTMATIREYFWVINPKKIIWQYYETHENRIAVEKKNLVLSKYLKDDNFSQSLKTRQKEIDSNLLNILNSKEFISISQSIEREKISTKDRIKRIIFLDYTRTALRLLRVDYSQLKEDLNEILKKTDKFIDNKAEKFFLYIPSYVSVTTKKTPSYILKKKDVLDIAIRNNFKIISADIHLKNYSTSLDLYPYPNAHFNKEGYDLIFKVVEKCLKYYSNNPEVSFCEPN